MQKIIKYILNSNYFELNIFTNFIQQTKCSFETNISIRRSFNSNFQ